MSVDDNPVRTREAYLLPTSYGQRRLWFLDMLEPASATSYTEHGALRIAGGLDVAALRAAVAAMVRRHETLRTGLVLVDGEPVQAVATELTVPVQEVDATGRVPAGADTDAVHAELADDIRELLRRPFDLTSPPLFRVVLYRLGPDDHVLVVAFHHAVYDQWSGAVFVRELLACYDAAVAGVEATLPELPVQYGDFAAWQREWVGGEEESGQLAYWERRLAGLPPLELPTDRPRPAAQTFEGATVDAVLPAELVTALDRLGREHQATLFMTVLTAFSAVLARHSGQEDLAVGTPVAGRRAPELEHLVGFFVNNLVLRVDASADPGFADLLGRVRDTCLDAYANGDVPFERVVERLRPDRDLARSPLFSVMFVFGNVPLPALRATGITAELFRVDPGTAKFDLFVTCVPRADGALTVTVEHNAALFDPATARRLLDHLRLVLDAAVAAPGRPLSELPLLADAERDQLVEWGRGPTREAPADTLPALVAARAAADPGRTAVSGASGRLSYADLVARAQRVAAALHAAGVRPGQLVGVAVDRDADLPAALLGVLGAGAAYLPIDVALPAERVRFVLTDSGAALVLADAATADALPGDVAVLRVDGDLPAADAWPARPGPDDLAYVIYTSGSTGTPKGVAVPHRALGNLLATMAERPGLGPDSVLCAVTTLSFDIAALELFGPLTVGGRVDVVPRDVAADGPRLAAHLAAAGATVVQATPATWRLLLAAGWRPGPDLAVWCGGEAFPPDLAGALAATGAPVWNLYGPTETTVWSTVHRVTGDENPVPLGGPVANTELLVVDGAGRRAPIGVPGELWIGGAGVASGYWRRDELTAQRFVAHPETPGARVYRTGDVARWRADGSLEYLGRADFQVKVRGHRIELGEIESVLRAHPQVRDAVVVVREDTPGDQRLVAYHVGDADPDELRAACRDRLPEYMVPATLVQLPALPLTGNGKVDRRALPAPDPARRAGAYEAPRGAAEERLAAIFADVLGLDRVGRDDDFFALGGHSLLATGLVGRIAAELGGEVPVRAVFAQPTVARLAAVLNLGGPSGSPELAAAPRRPDPDGRVRLPASFQQRRVWFLAQFEPDTAAAYHLYGGLRLHGRLDAAALRAAVDLVVRRHETLRTGFAAVDGEPEQVIHPAVPTPLSEVDLTNAGDPDAALAGLLRDAATRPFDLAAPPLLRVVLATLGADDAALLVTLHHAVGDRLAVEALTTELSAAYAALAAGGEPQLPELPVQYGDYAVAQQRWADGPAERRQLDHWRRQLADLPVLDLPTDRPRPAVQTYRGATRTAELPADLVARLDALAAGRGGTLFMALLAGYALTLSRYARTVDVPVGSPISGRYRPELEPLIGYFTNNLVLRTDLAGDPTVGELVDRVRDTCLDAYANADVPFERLVERLRPDRDLAHSPLFQVMFIAAHLPAPSLRLGDVDATPLRAPETAAKYDLTFTVFPAGVDTVAQTVVAEYNTDLFDAGTVDRLLAHYRLVLDAFAADADRSLSALPVLPTEERARLNRWGTGARPAVPEASLDAYVTARFAEFAERVAVADETGSLTYAELDAQAWQLARHLRAAGVTRGDRVALFAERCCDVLVALLGVLRAGAAYVPVDVDFPAERVAFILADSGASVVLTQAGLVDLLPELPEAVTVVRLDADRPAVAAHPAEPLPERTGPDDTAYLIYTSGSTGRPKGVVLPHRPVVNLLLTMANRPGMRPAAVVGAANTLSCDMPVLDVYLPLVVGARIEMIPHATVVDGERLAERLARSGVTYLQGTPTTWRLLQQAGWRPPAGFTALAGAERVPADLAHWLYGAGADVWHLYGPTETTVWSTVYRVVGGEDPLPLGGPVANTELLVVDDAGRRVPIGVPGELLIGGAGVASGYWDREELTAQRFVAHPEVPGARVYRTGDVVRWRADGWLEFLGRVDFQVKVRGHRIELGEIESVLRANPQVRDAVVVVREDNPGDQRLVGYADLHHPDAVDRPALAGQLHAACRERLPDYMVPSALVLLDALPLTANRNKVDRAKLPAPDGLRPDIGAYDAPRGAAEERLAAIFADVLALDRVGRDDDFFALGGHSLLATRVVSRIRDALDVDLPVRAVFATPTVAGLAAALPAGAGTTAPDAGAGAAAPAAEPAALPPIPAQFRMPQVGGDLAGRYVLPASSGQRRLWFLAQLDPAGAGAYTVDSAVRLTGPLDPDALHAALNAVVARHETLRTSFHEADGEPVQVVSPAAVVPLERVELADPGALDDTLTELSGVPFDLRTAPLLRATLVRLAADEHVLHLALHHAICDRWSVQILARDLVAAYAAVTGAGGEALPALGVQYGDYAAWQRQWTASPPAAAQLAYWRDRLADLPALELPTDRPRPATRAWRGDLRWDRIPADVVRRVTEAGRRRSATLFMVGLAACQLTLARYSGQRDFAVGSPVAGRPRTELEPLVGFFVNNLVLRADLTGAPTVGELLDRARATCLDAYAHADVPFDQLVEEQRPVRDRAQTPLFSVLFAVQNTPAAARAMGTVEVAPVDLRPGTAQFDLSIMLVPDPDGDLRLRVEYDAELFDAATVDRMAAQFRLVLEELAGDPARPVADLAPLTADEERLLLGEWVGQAPQPETPGLTARFREQARRTPDAVAAECGADRLTYAQLLDRATGLAARLRAAGVTRGDRVGIHLDRTLDLLVAVLGVLEAGAAYVPLDPSWPADRMRYVLDDAGVRALVAAGPLDGFTGPVLAPADVAGGAAPADDAEPAGPDDVAYLIYTSGSTGRPKGVMVTHRNVVRLVTGSATRFRFTPDDVWSMFHSVAFDVSVFEMWGAWLTGARVVVVPYLAGREPAELRALLARHRVTVLSQTPTAFRQLAAADAAAGDRLDSLRYVVFAGEALDVRILAGWFDRYGDARPELINMYGTTETTVHATFHVVRAAELADPGRRLVGRPLPDLRIVLLDADRRPVPLGAHGEVAIGGPGVSLGYSGRPELTAERFVASPYAGPGGTLYRTGDLARWLPDGNLDFLGRTDAQVKIRGFRVEPGEVEAVLREHPDVADVVVVARAGRADDTELAGYVVPRPGAAPAELRVHARRLLPEYLVPASLTLLDVLPRTANGKLDVRALPQPRHGGDTAGHVAPRDELEQAVADIWRQVLEVDAVGVHDNFFDLGGHSLLATRAMSRTRAALGVDAGVRDLFDRPTVAGLAERIRRERDGDDAVPGSHDAAQVGADAIPAVPRDGGLLPAAPAQRRLWLLHQLDPDSAGAYVIGSAVRLRGPLDADALAAAFADVVARHEALRTSFEVVDGEPAQRVHPELTVPVERVDLAGDVAAVAALTRDRLTAPFDLATAPLVRATLVRVDADEHHLLLALHHAVGDQWSTQVVVRDLVAAYRARVAGTPVDLPPPAVQYADVAAWQRDRLAAGGHDEDLSWWTERLAGLPVLDLPTDRVRPATRGHRGGQREAEVPAAVVDRLTGVARRHDATAFMVALAAYQLTLSRYAGQADFGVAVPVSGRDRPETENVVGFFANTLVLRADLAGQPRVAELLNRVRETCLAAYARADVPFDVLLERLGLTRDLSRTPVAQVGFALVDRVAAADREFAGVRAEPLPFDPGTAKTDLTVTMVPTDAGGWRLLAEYDADLFAPATVDRMLAHLAMLLAEIADDPDRSVSALPDLPAEEAAQLDAWGRGPERELPDATWPELFTRQVAATPDRPAVLFGDDTVTYADLNARANRLAHRLIDLGVAADALVGVLTERSVEMVVAVLAVLKAGGAYVPIDPGYPADRVAFMITDSGAKVLLTQAALTDRLTDVDATVVTFDDPDLAGLPATDPPRRSGPDDLAYVIYTSGSTGTPKGVAVEHRSVTNLWLTRYLAGLHAGSRVLQFAPFSFDVSVLEMVLSLLNGVPLVVPQPKDLAGGVEIVNLINRQRITFAFMTPSLLAHLSPEHVPTLELLGSGGEDCPAEVAERWGGRKRFLIGYGPTETTVYATVTDEIVGGGHPPIGRPVVNTVVRVLDERLRPRPIGAPGELYIGGPGLARGYLHRPELTETAFARHPVTGERLYRTGDLVRYLPDGNLEFLGRTDDQVKLRGFRIELGEIAAALRAAPGVAEAVAVVREDRPGDKRLVGYVVPAEGAGDEDELVRVARAAVAERLPHYMVPAAVVALPALPLTPNAKVDRKALPAPAGPVGGTGYVPPRTPTERRLTRLVAEALGVERVGLDDDFFAIGGHSLLAARLHATIRRLWGVDLPVRVLFERSRIGALADLLDEQGSVDTAVAEAEHAAALRADIALPDDVRPVGEVRVVDRPGTVLLTGATGFLGAYLARQLAEAGATVLCLVRGRDEADAQQRLEEQLRRYRCWRPEWADRFRALPGDLASPRLGLAPDRFAALAREVDEIYHCGAVVHFLRPYAMLRDGNVAGTIEILRLATLDRPLPVHYVSTMSVFGGLAPTGGDGPADATGLVLREDTLPDAPPPSTDTGYNHSKWVAEQVVELARARGVPVAVYRPGRIGGDSRTGTWRTDDLVSQVIRACVRTGLVPDTGLATDLVPVDHLAAVITGLARRRDALGRTFHFALDEKVPLVRLADALTDRGWPVRRASLDEWYAAVGEAARNGDELLGPVLAMYAPLAEGRVTGPGEPIFDDRNTRELLGGALPPPRVDTALLGRYLDALVADGFIPAPPGGGTDHPQEGSTDASE
ncbi:amino acid adenylation domain-containing protein [Micromonospora sp. NPDC048830]|uniref:non-ribosomal peptide synthetase n=1 Tax=Micromonospora sp. NPDC048830 TaxID=3364257 RepID=UPI003717FF29